jgi:hypothetical protein
MTVVKSRQLILLSLKVFVLLFSELEPKSLILRYSYVHSLDFALAKTS